MSIEKYLNEVANEGIFFNKKPKEYAKIETTINNLYRFGNVVESTINKLGIKDFYHTLESLRVPNKIKPKNEIVEQSKKIYDDGHHNGITVNYPVLTWNHVKSKEDEIKRDLSHLYTRLTTIVDLKHRGTILAFGGNYHFSILNLSDNPGHSALILEIHHVFTDKK